MENTRREILKDITLISAFVALSLLLFYVECFLPPLIPIVPFAKIGLANIVTLVAVWVIKPKKTFIVLICRCFLSSLFTGNIFALVYSLSGALASFLVIILLYKTCRKFLSIIVISIIAAFVHNIVQVLIAWLIVGNIYIITLIPYLLIVSLIAGTLTALCARFAISKIYLKGENV